MNAGTDADTNQRTMPPEGKGALPFNGVPNALEAGTASSSKVESLGSHKPGTAFLCADEWSA